MFKTFFITVLIAIILGWVLVGYIGCQGVKAVKSQGLKGVASQVWNCTNSVAK